MKQSLRICIEAFLAGLIFLALAVILNYINVTCEELERQKKNSVPDGSHVYIWVYNEEAECWDTYKCIIDKEETQ